MRLLLLPIVLFSTLAFAQSWCPQGATWQYYFGSQQASGIAYAQYSGDSMINGLYYKRIDHTIYAPNPSWMFGQPFISALDPLFTRFAEDVVHIRNSWTEADDTLMWFGAVPGDQWRVHGTWANEVVVVLDTGRYQLEGEQLRWLAVEIAEILNDTLRERIGFDNTYLLPELTLSIDYTVHGLQCYLDELLIGTYTGPSGSAPCGFTASVPSLLRSLETLPLPNPGTTNFTLELPPGPHTITLFDATGRMVLEQRTAEERPVIGTESLPAGLYRITVRDERGAVMGATWVKER